MTDSGDPEEYPCPECGEEMVIDSMITHRCEEHGLRISQQLKNVPDTDSEQKKGGEH